MTARLPPTSTCLSPPLCPAHPTAPQHRAHAPSIGPSPTARGPPPCSSPGSSLPHSQSPLLGSSSGPVQPESSAPHPSLLHRLASGNPRPSGLSFSPATRPARHRYHRPAPLSRLGFAQHLRPQSPARLQGGTPPRAAPSLHPTGSPAAPPRSQEEGAGGGGNGGPAGGSTPGTRHVLPP